VVIYERAIRCVDVVVWGGFPVAGEMEGTGAFAGRWTIVVRRRGRVVLCATGIGCRTRH
jgi:hypothetical protein